jgi:HEAT repeat protein
VEALIAVLKDRTSQERDVAANALGQIGDVRAAEPLVVALKDGSEGVRYAAAGALGQIGPKVAEVAVRTGMVEALLAALNDKYIRVAQTATSALGKIGARLEPAALRARVARALIDVLIGSKDDLRYAAVSLGQIADPLAVDPLIVVLGSDKYPARKAAAQALASLYQSGHLDEAHKQKILIQRDRMAAAHNDHTEWVSNGSSSDCTGSTVHTDNNGIEVSFPV